MRRLAVLILACLPAFAQTITIPLLTPPSACTNTGGSNFKLYCRWDNGMGCSTNTTAFTTLPTGPDYTNFCDTNDVGAPGYSSSSHLPSVCGHGAILGGSGATICFGIFRRCHSAMSPGSNRTAAPMRKQGMPWAAILYTCCRVSPSNFATSAAFKAFSLDSNVLRTFGRTRPSTIRKKTHMVLTIGVAPLTSRTRSTAKRNFDQNGGNEPI